MDIRGIRALIRSVGLLLQATAVLVCLGLCTFSAEAQDLFSVRSHSLLDHLLVRGIAADLDGDAAPDMAISRPDGQSSSGYRYRVDVQLSGSPSSTFFIISAEAALGLEITPRDVDGDRDLDLVISAEGSHRRIGIWLNDGAGGFSEGALDSYPADQGTASSLCAAHAAVLHEVFLRLRDDSSPRIAKPVSHEPVLASADDLSLSPLLSVLAPATIRRRGRAPPAFFSIA